MDYFEVCREALEDQLVVLVVDAQLLGLPVDVPRPHGAVAPRLLVLHRVWIDENEAVVGNAQQLLHSREIYRERCVECDSTH